MAVIKSGDTADQLKVDSTSKAARVTLYSSSGSELTAIPVDITDASVVVTDGGGSLTVDGSVAVNNHPSVQPVNDNGGSLTVDGTVTANAGTGSWPVTDGGGSLTVDGTVAVSNTLFPVSDNSGSLTVDTPQLPNALVSGRLDVNIGSSAATVPISGTISVSNLNIQQQIQPATLFVTATGATAAAVTATLPAAGPGLYHYITYVEITAYNTAARTGGATPVVVTATNLPGSPAWTVDSAAAIGVTQRLLMPLTAPLKASSANAATTIVAPATTGIIWRLNVMYYTAT